MKYLYQLGIILGVSFLGEVLYALLPLPIPASIYGLLLMLIALITGVIKLEKIKETSAFLLEIMTIMFLPPGVALLNSFDLLKPILLPVAVIVFAVTVIVMAVTGRVSQAIIRHDRRKKA